MGVVGDKVQAARRLVPLTVLVALARRRAEALWDNAEYRASQVDEMRFVLENTGRAAEIEDVARAYVEFATLRNYRRWHPGHLTRQPVEGIEHLTEKRDRDRGVVLSFLHHGQYDGLFGSLARHGVEIHAVCAPEAFDPHCPVQLRQHFKVVGIAPETTLVPATVGSAGMTELLTGGAALAIASDVAGRTPINFLGHRINGSFGAARLATQTNSPVVLVTSHRDPSGSPRLRVHAPLEPGDFADPADLLQEMLDRHTEAVLAWPEAFDSPYGRLVLAAAG